MKQRSEDNGNSNKSKQIASKVRRNIEIFLHIFGHSEATKIVWEDVIACWGKLCLVRWRICINFTV